MQRLRIIGIHEWIFPLLAQYSWAVPLNTVFLAYKTIEPSEFDPLNKSLKSCSTSLYAAFCTPR